MPSNAYYEWVNAGRPLEPCTPVREVVERMRAAFPRAAAAKLFSWHANEAHYQAVPPQDHTPFSVTGQPLPSPRWVVFATDITHRPDLGVDCNNLFAYWIAEARAGRLPTLKYLIWQAKLYHYSDGFQRAQANSGHYDHIHCSFRTDHRYTSLGSWSLIPGAPGASGGDDDMYEQYDRDRVQAAWTNTAQIIKDVAALGQKVGALVAQPVTLTEADRTAIIDGLVAKLGPKLEAVGAPSLDAIRKVVDEELDEQSRAGADVDPA